MGLKLPDNISFVALQNREPLITTQLPRQYVAADDGSTVEDNITNPTSESDV